MPALKLSDNDIENFLNSVDMDKFQVFREYEKNNNMFLATSNFFISSHFDNNSNDEKYIKIFGNTNEKYIEKKNDKYLIHYNIKYNESEIIQEVKEINLIIIKNIKIELSNDLIDIKKLIKEDEISSNECDELIRDLYFNSVNFKKFNLTESKKMNQNKKYLFKIKKGEINIRNQIEQCHVMI